MTSAAPSERFSGFFIRLSAAGNRFLAAVSGDFSEAKAYARRAERSPRTAQNSFFPVPQDLQAVFHLKRMQDLQKRAALLKKTADYEACLRRDEGAALSAREKSFDGLMLIRLGEDAGSSGQAAVEKTPVATPPSAKSAGGGAPGFSCDFFNKDGSFADLCGNAACCAAFFGREIGRFNGPSFSFSFAGSDLRGDFDENGQIWLSVPKPPPPESRLFVFQEKEYCFDFVRPGVPHGVLKCDGSLVKNPSKFHRLLPLAKAFRENGNGKEGANVTFFHYEKEEAKQVSQAGAKESRASRRLKKRSGGSAGEDAFPPGGGRKPGERIEAATYERGVENWTGACGTGALAAALSFEKARKSASLQTARGETKAAGFLEARRDSEDGPDILTVKMPGGALKVRLSPRFQLSSPAKHGWE